MRKFIKFLSTLIVTVIAVILVIFIADRALPLSEAEEQTKIQNTSDKSNNLENTDNNSKVSETNSKKYKSLEEFVKSDKANSLIEQAKQSVDNEIMTFTMMTEDKNKIIFQYECLEQTDIDIKNLEKSLNNDTELYVDSVKYILEIVNIENPCIVVRYINADKTLIYERSFNLKSVVEEISQNKETSKYENLEEYINSEEVQNIFEETKNSLKNQSVNFNIKAEDKKIVYEYKYKEQINNKSLDEVSDILEKGLKEYEDVYINLAEHIENIVNIEGVTIAIRYINLDDSIIFEKEYTKKI